MTKQTIVDEPLQSIENRNHIDEKQSIWASILRDVKSSTKKAPAPKSLVVLGDNESGRTTLVAKLQGNDDPKRGAGLEYHYIDVKDDDRDDTPKLGVWILDGDVACSAPLLKFAIKPETLENTVLILVATMKEPWSLLSTLKKWTTLIEEHIDRLKLDPTHLREIRDHLQYDFQHYIEPNDSSIMLTTTIKSGNRISNSISSSTTPLSPTNGEEQVVLPLDDGVLTKSLGIHMIVVITKCDIMPILEKENDYKDEQFDFIQYHLRKFCLEYGAALFYTSVKEKKNIDKLYKYIIHKCYGYPFTSSAAIVDRDAIFIPFGWDNKNKVEILLENLHRLKSTDNYSDVCVKPIVRRPLQRDNEILMAEDDQEFLTRLQLTINRAASPVRGDENATTAISRTSKPPNVTPSDPNRTTNEGALANFFNSLLTKKSGGAVTPTSAGTPTTQRQTSQSPTTPSSKRLQQHPLTFAVTPPPGRSRTPTTSHKTFSSSLNTDLSPNRLLPVDEQQSEGGIISSSSTLPTIVRTPVEDSEPVNIFDTTEDKQSSVIGVESDPILNVEQQHSESIISQHDSISNTINNSTTENPSSPSRSSSLIEEKSHVTQTPSNDESHQRLSNDFFPSQSSLDRTSPPLLSSPTVENKQQLNDNDANEIRISSLVPHEVAPQSLSHDISLNNTNEEQQQQQQQQQDNSKASSNSSRRSSTINISIPSQPSSPISNEPAPLSPMKDVQNQPDDDATTIQSEQLGRRISSTDIQSSEVPNEDSLINQSPQYPSASNINTSEEQQQLDQIHKPFSNKNNNYNHSLSPSEEFVKNPILHSTENNNSSSITENHNNIQSSNFNLQSTTLIASPTRQSADTKPESPSKITESSIPEDENTRSRSPSLRTEQEQQRSRSPSPTAQLEQQRSRSPSLTAEQEQKSSRSPSLTTEQEQKRSRSPSPTVQLEQQRSRSISPTAQLEQQRSRSPSPTAQLEQQRSHSSSLTTEQEQKRSRSPSPTVQQEQQRSRSISPTAQLEQQRSRSPSPTPQLEQQRSRSPSLTAEQEQKSSRSPSLTTEQEQKRSRSPSPTAQLEQQRTQSPSLTTEQEQQRSRSPSLTTEQEQKRSRSPSPTVQQEQQRSRSISPTAQLEQQRSRSPSPTAQLEQQRSRSPSLTTEQDQQRSRSSSPTAQPEQQRSRSPSLTTEQEQQRSRSPSLTIEQEQKRSPSSSPITEQEQPRSRSPSPITEHKQEQKRSRSPSPTPQLEQQRSRSPSLTTEQDQQRSRSPSPTAQLEQQRSRSPSLTTEQEQQRSRSPSLTTEQEQKRSRSPSPTAQLEQQRSQSPSLTTEQEQKRSRSPSPTVQLEQQRSGSPSPTAQQEQQRSQSPSPTAQLDQQKSRSPSLIPEQEQKISRSSSPITEQEQPRSRSPSPITEHKQEQKRSRSPSPTVQLEHERSRSSSLKTEQVEPRTRSPSPTAQQEHQKSRSSSPTPQLEQQRSRSPSLTTEQEQQRSRSSSSVTEEKQEQQRSRSPSLTTEQEQQRSRSPSLTTKQEQQRSRSPSPTVQLEQQRSRSPSPTAQLEQQRSRSPSPTVQQEQQRSRSPSLTTEQEQQRSRSPAPIIEQKQEQARSRSPSPTAELEQQRSRSPSLTTEQEQQRSRSPSPSAELEEQESRLPSLTTKQEQKRSRSPSPITETQQTRNLSSSSPLLENHEKRRSSSPNVEQNEKRSGSSSATHQDQRKDSFSRESSEDKPELIDDNGSLAPISDGHKNESPSANKFVSSLSIDSHEELQSNALVSPKLEENKSLALSPDLSIDTTDHLKKDVAPSSMIEPEESDRSRSASGTNNEEPNEDYENVSTSVASLSIENVNELSEKEQQKSQEEINNEQLKNSPSSSSLIENLLEAPLLASSSINQQEPLFTIMKNENKRSSLSSPSLPPFTENHSSQLLKSPVDENIPSTTLNTQNPMASITPTDPEDGHRSHPSIQRSSSDHHHHHEFISIPSVVRRPSITRSQSQSTVARPNTLPFSPNNHDLDGLYTSNDYNDEDEIPEDNEYHHNSAPSTVNVEYRRSSLLHNYNVEQQHSPIDPNDISKRLSIVEKSRTNDGDSNDVEPTNSKDT